MLANLTLSGFADQTGGSSSAPGGGSVAAYAGSIGAALVEMVCRLTIGKKGFEAVEDKLRSELKQAENLKAKLLTAVDEDTDAYLEVIEAYRLPKDTAEEKTARKAAVDAAMRHAALVPLATAEAALDVLVLAEGVSTHFNPATASDLGVAVQSAMTGVRGGILNVTINLSHLGDESLEHDLRRQVAAVERRADETFAELWRTLRETVAGES